MAEIKNKPLIHLLNKPCLPTRRVRKKINYGVTDARTVDDILQWIGDNSLKPADCAIEVTGHDVEDVFIAATVMESDSDFNIRLRKYDAQLDRYNQWWSENEDLINKEILRREALDSNRKILESNLKKARKSVSKAKSAIKKLG